MVDERALKSTRNAFLWTRILSTPFFVIFTLLPIILYKDLKESLFAVTLFITLKPAVSLIAPYWSLSIIKRPDRLISNLIWANILKFIPFLFIPFCDSIYMFFFASLFYLALGRGVIPAWMETLKLNIPEESRTKVFAYGQALDYLGIALFPLLFGWSLDYFHEAWRFLFPVTAFIGICSTLFLFKIPKKILKKIPPPEHNNLILKPWKESFKLLKERPDFLRFQLGFMLGGSGLMILQPAFPVFFTDVLKLSYQEMSFAIAFCKGIAYAMTSLFWAKLFRKVDIFRFCSVVTLSAAAFPLILMLSELHITYLFVAFFCYGVMQAGSELSWHLSGPAFAKEGDSSLFSSTNILTQGLRGAIVPYIGAFLCQGWGSKSVLIAASCLCLLATLQMSRTSSKLAREV